MMNKAVVLGAAAALAALTYVAGDSLAGDTLAGDISAGQQLYASCAGCHGAGGEGNRDLHAPALAGQDASYLEGQLWAYRSGARGTSPRDTFGKQMSPSAHALADEEAVAAVSAYIAALTVPAGAAGQGADGEGAPLGGNAALGRNLYGSCAACHGARAEGNPALKAPRLDMLQDWYIVGELKDYRDGLRGSSLESESHTGPVMTPMDTVLPDEAAMRNVAAYIGTL